MDYRNQRLPAWPSGGCDNLRKISISRSILAAGGAGSGMRRPSAAGGALIAAAPG
jgi:hypothetical protein